MGAGCTVGPYKLSCCMINWLSNKNRLSEGCANPGGTGLSEGSTAEGTGAAWEGLEAHSQNVLRVLSLRISARVEAECLECP